MRRAALAGIAYFAIVFAIGFVLGTLRVLFVAPAIGPLRAALLETPIILAASWLVSGRLLSRLQLSPGLRPRLIMGTVAFVVTIIAEAALGVYGFGRAWPEQVQAFLEPVGLVGLGGQLLFALMPLARGMLNAPDRR